jgi:glycosyltransferase involved in cell wall biosynthesis
MLGLVSLFHVVLMMSQRLESPFFSVIIATYDRAGFLQRALASLCDQTFSDLEVIVVDDASSDATGDVVRSAAQTLSLISLRNEANLERSRSRNRGANHASGRYLLFLDDDDRYEPDHLDRIHRAIVDAESEPDILYTDLTKLEESTGEREHHRFPTVHPGDDPIRVLYGRGRAIPTPALIIDRALFAASEGFDPELRIAEDIELLMRLLLVSSKVLHLPITSLVQVKHDENSNRTRRWDFGEELRISLGTIIRNGEVARRVDLSTHRDFLAYAFLKSAEHHQAAGRRSKAMASAIRAIVNGTPRVRRCLYLISWGLRLR